VHTYAVSPVFSVMEMECVKELGKILGYDLSQVDGLVSPGGSFSNMTAMILAR